jgi:cytochrome c oxidase subunit 1
MPRRYSDYPDFYAGWNFIARVGSIISVVSVLLFVCIIWERFASQRPVICRIHIGSSLEFYHSFPPLAHSFQQPHTW